MDIEFVRFVDVDGDVFYLRKSKINSIYVHSEKKCTAIDFDTDEVYYVKGSVDEVARTFMERGIGNIFVC